MLGLCQCVLLYAARYLTHEFMDAAAQQAKKQQQQRKESRETSTKEAQSKTARPRDTESLPCGQSAVEADNEPSAEVVTLDGPVETEWLVGEPTITPSHLAAVFQDNEDWAAVMREFTFDQPPSPLPAGLSPSITHAHNMLDTPAHSSASLPKHIVAVSSPLLPPLLVSPPPLLSSSATAAVYTPQIRSPAQRQLQLTDDDGSASKQPSDTSFTCSLFGSSNAATSASPTKQESVAAEPVVAQPGGDVRQRGSRSHRPTLSACRGWAGGSKGDAVSRYRPVVRRSADGRLCVDNPYA